MIQQKIKKCKNTNKERVKSKIKEKDYFMISVSSVCALTIHVRNVSSSEKIFITVHCHAFVSFTVISPVMYWY